MIDGGLLAVVVALGAAPSTARLEYELRAKSAQCPDARWVRAAVSARLGRDPFDAAAALEVRARIDDAGAGGLIAVVEVARPDGTSGKRTLESPLGDCLELASAVELAITLAIEPLWMTKKQEPAPTPAPAPAPAPQAPPAPAAAPAEAVEPRQVELGVRIGPLATAGGVPGVTTGLLVGGVVKWPRVSLALEGRAHLPSGVDFGFGRASAFTALGSVVPCARLGRFSACGVVSIGAFQVESSTADVRRATTVMAQAGARFAADFHLASWLALAPWLEAAVVLTRTSLVSGSSTVWVTWPVSIAAGIHFDFDFSS